MIPDKLLVKLSLVVIILGLVGLYFISVFVTPKFVELSEIGMENVGEIVKTTGLISKSFLSEKSNTLFLDLEENGVGLKVVMFNIDKNLFEKGDEVSVEGEVSIYEGELEIIAKDIYKIE